jgi:hypothetical protein
MKKLFLTALLLLLSFSTALATISAANCSLAEVSNAIATASRGETIIVPAGNCV